MTDSLTRSAGGAATPEGFRAMMRGFPTGVAVVTAMDLAGTPWGMTCSSVCSVAMEPPTLLVCLREESPTLAAILVRGRFAVNLLHEGAQDTAELFSSGNPDRFGLIDWDLGADAAGPHLPKATHAVADCWIVTTKPVGDHVVVFGEVVGVTWQVDCRPLLYGLRSYRSWKET